MAFGDSEERCGQKVGHGFSDAGAAFYHQVLAVIHGFGDTGQHLFLLWPVFESGEHLGEGTFPG